MSQISISIDSEIVGELFLRKGPKTDVATWIETVVWDYLERTADDGRWEEAYYAYRQQQRQGSDFTAQFGDPKEGYHWAPLFLPNGTMLRMEYKRETKYATVKFSRIDFEGKDYSPSELASVIASNTSRNAWRDLYIKRPGETDWVLADDLRRRTGK